jgi:hypothetical protein
MNRASTTGARLAALFGLGCLLLNYPLLMLFDRPATLFGVPLGTLYLFVAWLLIILFAAVLIERHHD